MTADVWKVMAVVNNNNYRSEIQEMGQSGLWPFPKELGIVETPVNPKTILKLHIYLPAVLFNYTTKMDFCVLKKLQIHLTTTLRFLTWCHKNLVLKLSLLSAFRPHCTSVPHG
ncbi:hypothetical protein DFQ27_005166 [Actinomortierella ambigua]|uniref:Uncharacterized protein n=1 Tax=Actinomortierella ambigua TaxID=1343610 RepID=A0A9P6U3B8_9FUNG|nr:hypothetical protein DFQ27_005166 [Actinomortierella ambigua]